MKVPPGTKDFDPAAHTHLARTLDGVGHRAAASQVRLAREHKLRRAEYFRVRATQPRFMDFNREAWWKDHLNFRALLKRWFNAFFGFVFGYGHAPMRAFGVSVVVVVLAAIFFGITYSAGQMAPNSPVILASAEWQDAVEIGCTTTRQPGCNMPLHIWDGSPSILAGSLTHRDYETFNAFAYGFDLFIPLVALGQEAAWAPSYERGWLGAVGYYLRWPTQVLGWVIAAVTAATLAGVVGRKD